MKCFNCGQEGHPAWKCTWSKELAGGLQAQFARCVDCKAIIYAWDKSVPCELHRTVGGWREYYHSPQFTADTADRLARIAATRSEFRAGRDSRSTAARQVAEARAARTVLT